LPVGAAGRRCVTWLRWVCAALDELRCTWCLGPLRCWPASGDCWTQVCDLAVCMHPVRAAHGVLCKPCTC
jgi:hypothetical protein